MPRLFYKIVVGVLFAILTAVLLGAEILFTGWLVDRFPSKMAWAAFIILGIIDIPILLMLFSLAATRVREA